jgi:UDP-N-acetylglucosamine 1-carboxyvinyltransferase
MGAKIELFQPKVENPKEFYNFDQPISDDHLHGLRIIGPTSLKAGTLNAADLRAGSTLTIAATIAHGTSTINNVHHIDRGYESLDKKLRDLGAKIKRVKAS